MSFNLPVRFFRYTQNDDCEITIEECSELTFLEEFTTTNGMPSHTINYERHTMHENGVSQICLTATPF